MVVTVGVGSAPSWSPSRFPPRTRCRTAGSSSSAPGAEWRPEGGQYNAFLYAGDGVLERSACVGDGVEWAQTTRLGNVWVSYFDEGIFGNLGWGNGG